MIGKNEDMLRPEKWLVWNGALYKKSFSRPLLKCVPIEKGKEVLEEELHEGLWGSHIGAAALAEKALRTGDFWPSIRHDAKELVQKCRKCQIFANIHQRPANFGKPILSPF